MKVLIIGGTTFTGPHICRRLLDDGHQVIVFHRGQSTAPMPLGVTHLLGGKEELPKFAGSFRGLSPDVVIHMLAVTEEDATQFVDVFNGCAGRAIVISSCDVYLTFGRIWGTEPGPPVTMPLTEESPLRQKLSHRGERYNKTAVERVVMNADHLPSTIIRYPGVYGPNDPQHRVRDMDLMRLLNRPVLLIEDKAARVRFTWGYAEDVAYGVTLAITHERSTGQVYHLGEADTPTIGERLRQIATHIGWNGRFVELAKSELPAHLKQDIEFDHHLMLDTSKVRRDLRYQEVADYDEALRRTIEWELRDLPEITEEERAQFHAEDEVLERLGL